MPFDQVKTQVLLLHSEQRTLDNLSSGFTDRYTVHCATSGTEALNTLTETPIHVIISAQELPGMSGIEALREAKKRSPETIGILLASRDDDDHEALVGYKEVFQIVHGGVSAEDISKLVDNATQQMRLLALAESANDMAANPDEPVTEHIVMETSENGSAIISDGTGTVPVLDPTKISAAAAVGSRAVDVLVLTKDDEFLATVRESSRGMHNIRYANTLAQAEQAISKYEIGVAVVDAAMAGPNVEKLTEHLRGKTSRLVSIVAGRRDDGEMLMDLINRGKVYRFLLKPVSPGRARLAVEASVKHHLEAPESAFKARSKDKAAPAPKPKAASRPQPAAKPRPKAKAAPKPVAKPAAKPVAKSAPKPVTKPRPKPRHVKATVDITPSLENDRLASAFDGDDASFTETMTGIVASIGEKFSSRKKSEEAQPAPVPTPAASADSSGGSPFTNPRILGIGAVAIVAVIAIGAWIFSGSGETQPDTEQVASQDTPANVSAAIDTPTATATPVQEVVSTEEIDIALTAAESAMLDRRIDDAVAALSIVSNSDPDNARLPFLTAQLSQMQLREYLGNARAAIRESRLEDAANDLRGAGTLDIADTTEIDAVAAELAAAHSEQRLDTVLAQATDRLDQGKLLSPANDNAGYFYNLVLRSDPDNAAAQQGLTMIASKLVLQARTEIDANRFNSASGLLSDARRLDSSSDELATATQALTDARNRVAEDARRDEANRMAAEKSEADRVAAEKRAEDNRKAAAVAAAALVTEKARADRLATEKAQADRLAAEKAQADRLAAEKAEADRLAAEEVEADRLAAEKVEADRLAAEKVEADRLAAEKVEADRLVAEKAEADRLAAAIAAAAIAAAASPPAGSTASSPAPQTATAGNQGGLNEEPVGISSLTRVKYVAPRYPRTAERRNLSGWVDVVFTVATDGTTKDVVARNSEPGQTFVNAAIKAVEKWKFMPVFDNGMVVERRAGVRMMFAIE